MRKDEKVEKNVGREASSAPKRRVRKSALFPDGGVVMSIWVPRSLLRALITLSEGQGRSLSAVVREMLIEDLARR